MYVNYWVASSKAVVLVNRPIKVMSMHIQKPLKLQREIILIELTLALIFAISICPVNMNV